MPTISSAAHFRSVGPADLESEAAEASTQEDVAAVAPVRRGRWAVAGVAAAVAGTAAVAFFPRSAPAGVARDATAVVTLDEAKAAAPAPSCSGEGQNCLDSQCCWPGGMKGMQCYAKDQFWASCAEDCKKGVHEGETHGTYDQWGTFHPDEWSCDKLGKRSEPGCEAYDKEKSCPTDRCKWKNNKCTKPCWQFYDKASCPGDIGCIWDNKEPDGPVQCIEDPCAAPGEDCTHSKCCSSMRGAAGFSCFAKNKYYATCMPSCGGDDKKDWSCKQLGNRSGYQPGCAWAGKSCAKDHLCCNTGFDCLVKDDTFMGCQQTTQKSTWFAKKIPVPSDWRGTFVGPGRTEYSVPAAGDGEQVSGTMLYCFMAYLPDSSEVQLMQLAKLHKASIFGCDGTDVFQSWKSASAGWDTGESTLTNTDVFINVWEQVAKSGKYLNFDWTVKVDADALLVPERLRQHIAGMRPPANRAIYLKNNAMDAGLGNNGFLGAVEVFSKVAVMTYFDNAEGCRTTMGINAGEDGFFKGCMDAIGVGFMTDPNLFNPDVSPGICNNEGRAAFHPLKDPVNWQCCLDIISGHPHNVVYGHCELGYDLKFQ